MKKTIIITALILVAATQGSFARDSSEITQAQYANFKHEFSSATDVRWQTQKNYAVATFSLNGKVMSAYYTPEAKLLAVLQQIPVDHLPIFLMNDVKKVYGDYWVSGLFEAVTDGESHYYLTLENGDEILKLKSVGTSYWAVEKKMNKDTD